MTISAQLVVFLDKSGNFHAELPGENGARIKVHLGDKFRERNPEIAVALMDKQAELDRRRERIEEEIALKHNAKSQAEKLAELAAERAARFASWLDTLPRDRREAEILKYEARLARARETELARARDIWSYNAEHHGIDFANKITDSTRRPNRKVKTSIVYGSTGVRKELSPRTGAIVTASGRKANPNQGMDL